MRKKISLLVLSIITISLLVSVSSDPVGRVRTLWTPGDPYIPCYPSMYVYEYPQTTIALNQTVSFDIPSCPPMRMIQIGGMGNVGNEADTTTIDQPTLQYQCSLSSDQGCCVYLNGGSYIQVCPEQGIQSLISVTIYDSQGIQIEVYTGIEDCTTNLLAGW